MSLKQTVHVRIRCTETVRYWSEQTMSKEDYKDLIESINGKLRNHLAPDDLRLGHNDISAAEIDPDDIEITLLDATGGAE